VHTLIAEIRQTVTSKGIDVARVEWMRRVAEAQSAPIETRTFAGLRASLAERDERVNMLSRIGRQYLGL
jgi:hypothetical protein